MQTQERNIAQHVEIHTVVKIVADVGHTEEMDQVVVAEMIVFENGVTAARRPTALELMNVLMHRQIFHYGFGLAEIVALVGKLGVWLVIEIAHHLITIGRCL